MQQLIDTLSSRRYPVLTHLSAEGERLELTGTVVANWVYKTTSLFADTGLGPDLGLGIVLTPGQPLHWRALTAMLAAFGSDAPVTLLNPTTASVDAPPAAEAWVAFAAEDQAADEVTADADEVFVYSAPALALAAHTPPDCIDFNSEVRAHPDVCPIPGTRIELRVGDTAIVTTSTAVTGSITSAADAGPDLTTTGIPSDEADLHALLTALATGTITLQLDA